MKNERISKYAPNKKQASLKDTLIVLCLCVSCVAVIAATFWISGINRAKNEKSQVASYSEKAEIAESDVNEISTEENISEEIKAASAIPAKESDENVTYEAQTAVSAETAAVTFSAPVRGALIKEHTTENLVYSKTLEDWRTHVGIDVAAKIGSTVCACGNGVIKDAYKDARFGYTVVIEHENGMKSIYGNLTGIKMAKTGREVLKGDPIGMVGDSAVCEALDDEHLHFEMVLNGEYVNPLDYFSLE